MPDIPLYHFTPHSAGPANVRADTGMMDAQYAAGARIGQALQSDAAVLTETATRLQQANNYKYATQLDIAMQDEWDKFQQELNPASDETKWQADWQKRLDARVAATMPKDAGTELRDHLTLSSQQFKVRTSGDIGMQAKAAGVEKATLSGSARVEQLWRNGDAPGAEAELHRMAGLGLILPEKIPSLVQKGQSRMTQQEVSRMIATDPIAAHDALEEKTASGRWKNFSALDEDDRLTLINHARTQTTAIQSDNYQELIDGLNNNEVKAPEQLQAMVDKKLITPKQQKSYTAAYHHGKFNTDPTVIGGLFTEITNYDPQKDPHQTQRAALLGKIATSGFPTNVQNQANELLGKKADPTHVLNSAVAKDAFEGIDQSFRLGIYGKYETRRMETKGPMAGQWTTEVNPAVFQSAMATKRQLEDATRQFLEANPKATGEQVNKFIYEAGRKARLQSIWSPATINPLTGKAGK